MASPIGIRPVVRAQFILFGAGSYRIDGTISPVFAAPHPPDLGGAAVACDTKWEKVPCGTGVAPDPFIFSTKPNHSSIQKVSERRHPVGHAPRGDFNSF